MTESADHSAMTRRRLWCFLIAAATLIVHANGIHGSFVFDDVPELLQNPDVRSFRGCLETIAGSRDTGLSGRPAACLTFAANVAVGGFHPAGFHVVNIAIHLAAALTLFGLIRRTIELAARRQPSDVDAVSMAGAAAMLWAVHPLHTESVTYIVQRIESLSSLLYLLTLYGTVRAAESDRPARWRVVAVACCAAGMLTKEIVATAPLTALLLDRTFIAGSFREAVRRSKWLYAGLAATWIIPAYFLAFGARGSSAGFGLGVGPLDYLRTQAGVILHYLRLSVWPDPLAISYSDWPIARTWSEAMPAFAVIACVLLIGAVGIVRGTEWGFLVTSFFILLSPSSSVVPIVTEPAAERRLYLPLIVVVILAVRVGMFTLRRLREAGRLSPRGARRAGAGICAAAVVGLGARTVVRNADYASAEIVLAKTLAVRPGDELIRSALIEILAEERRWDEARRTLDEGFARNPSAYLLHDQWGRCMTRAGRFDEAVASFRSALAIRPDHAPTVSGLGTALAEQGRWTEAVEQFRRATALAPHAYRSWSNLGVALANLGRTDEAVESLQTAVRLKPGFVDARFNLGRLLLTRGDATEAAMHLRVARELAPNDEAIRYALEEATRKSETGR